jgi:membrane dipeptidase
VLQIKEFSMIVVDAHQDIAYNAFTFGRDYRRSALKTRQMESESGWPGATCGLPEAIAGRVAVIFATLFAAPNVPLSNWEPMGNEIKYSTPQEAYKLAMQQVDYYDRLADETARIDVIRDQKELDSVLATWEEGKTIAERKQGFVILMEGADPIIEPRQFEEWYERGVRIVGPAWSRTRYCGGTGEPGGLTKLGFELLDVMASFNAILDLSHMAEEAFMEAVDRYDGILIASHSNPRRFRDSDRHLSDPMIRRLAERDGVMGIVLYNRFLSNEWSKGSPKTDVTLSTVADAIDHVCQATGSYTHVGIGTDFDGGFGYQSIPAEIDTVADTLRIADVLRERGYAAAEIEAIMGGNMLRKLRQALQ